LICGSRIQRAHQRTSFHARSSQREASNASVTPNVPDDLSNRPFENRTSSPSAISAVGKLEIKGNARETQHDYLSKKEPRSPSYPFPNARKRTSDSNPNRLADPDTEPRTIQQSRARVMNLQGAEEYWRGPAKPPGHSSLFDPERGSPLTSSPTATRVYDPRTHIFRSKKAYESKPGKLPYCPLASIDLLTYVTSFQASCQLLIAYILGLIRLQDINVFLHLLSSTQRDILTTNHQVASCPMILLMSETLHFFYSPRLALSVRSSWSTKSKGSTLDSSWSRKNVQKSTTNRLKIKQKTVR
jgi:hypothetical protein